MATSGLYGSSPTGAVVSAPGSESAGLYGNGTTFGGSYFEWFIFIQSDTQPATPTGGSWSFQTNSGTPPTGWSTNPPAAPTLPVWVSIALVNSRDSGALVWSAPGVFSYSSGLPILSGSGSPTSGDGLNSQLWIQTGTTPETIWFKQSGTWVRLTGSTLYVDTSSTQTVGGTKTFSSVIQGSVSGTSNNVTGIVSITNGGTGQATANTAFNALAPSQIGNTGKYLTTDGSNTSWAVNPLGTVTSINVSGGTTGLTTSGGPITTSGTITLAGTLAVANGGTGVTTSTGSGSVVLNTSPSLESLTISDYETFGSVSAPTYAEGRLWYDLTQKALTYNNDISGNSLHVGQETQLKVRNGTGSTIAKGAPVYITSTSSGQTYPNVALSIANTLVTGNCIGLANEAIASGADGYVVINGILNGVNTGTFTVGDILYVSPYSAGQLMNTFPPTGYPVRIGVVSYVNSSTGSIYINQSNAFVQASSVVGTLAVANGGSGQTTAQAAMNTFAGAVTSGSYLRGNGTNVVMSTIQAADVPTLNQNTTGTASNVTGTVAIANGGTGATTAATARTSLGATTIGGNVFTLTNPSAITFPRFNADNTVSALDAATFRTAIGAGTSSTIGTVTSVSGTGTVNGLTLTGTVTTSGSLTLGGTLDLSAYNGAGAFSTLSASGNVTLSGGTANGVAYLNGSNVVTSGSALTFDGTNLTTTGNYLAAAGKGIAYSGDATRIFTPEDNVSGGLLQWASGGVLRFNAGASNELMRLTSTGLLVNTTSPVTGSKLVVGSADATIYGITVGRGAGAVSTNTAVGASALAANTTGSSNSGFGVNALNSNQDGIQNSAFGYQALNGNVSGYYNVAMGYRSLFVNTGNSNVGIGTQTLTANTTASYGTAVGYQAGYSNTTGSDLTVFGNAAGRSNTTGTLNVAVGSNALYTNTTGGNHVAIGYQSLFSNTTASYNTAVGYKSLYANTTGQENVAMGWLALTANTTANQNVAIGNASLTSNTTGASNVAVGQQALQGNTTASNNVAVGYQAGYSGATATQNVLIGVQAGYTNGADRTVAIGYQTLYANTGDRNTAVGWATMVNNTTGGYNAAYGHQALGANTTGSYNTATGYNALYSNTTASNNTAVGYNAGYSNQTGTNNVAIGYQALFSNTTNENVAVGNGALFSVATSACVFNVAVGHGAAYYTNNSLGGIVAIGNYALNANTTGIANVAVGSRVNSTTTGTLVSNTTGSYNTALGAGALTANTTGNYSTAIGYQALATYTGTNINDAFGSKALQLMTTGGFNLAVGFQAGLSGTTGSYNVFIGRDASYNITTGNNHVVIGYQAGYSQGSAVRNTFVGYNAGYSCTGNDNMFIGQGCAVNASSGSGNISIADLSNLSGGNQIFNLTTESNRIIMGHNNITNAYVKVAWTVTSDARDKMDFEDVPHGLSFLRQFNPVSYYMRKSRDEAVRNGRKRYGYKAQDILVAEGANPVIIDNEKEDHLKYNGEALVPVLHNAIKEMADMIDQLKAEIAALKGA